MTSQTSLQIGIVGAGVAGLSAAIGLRGAGHHCELFERSQFRNENGAAVSLTPNGGRILSRWGFDSNKAHGIPCSQVRRPKGDTLEPMAPTLNFSNIEEQFGARWTFYHRVDMHRQFREMATSPDLPGPPSTINLGCQVVDADLDAGTITLKDGRTFQKDLVIIADGQHDQLNYKITGESIPMQKSGQTAYRCLIPMKDILSDPVTAPLFQDQPFGFWAPALPQKGVMCVTYPCRDGEILNCLIVSRRLGQHASDAASDTAIEDWNFPCSREHLESVVAPFHPAVQALMLKSADTKMYTQMKRQPLRKMFKGKAVLIGDAAHPMLLTHAQGVSSSIEDAAALEILLSNFPSTSNPSDLQNELQRRLHLFETLRLPRVSATQIMTDPVLPGPNAAAAYVKMEETIRMYYDGVLPPVSSMPHSPPICAFFFGYDVTKVAEGVLESYLKEQKVDETQVDAVASKVAEIQVQEVKVVDGVVA